MKLLSFLLPSFFLGLFSFHLHQGTATLSGTVTEQDSKEPLIGATIRVLHNKDVVANAISDFDGKFALRLDPGSYTVQCSYTGYESQVQTGVVLTANKTTELGFALKSTVLEEVVITDYKVNLPTTAPTGVGMTLPKAGPKKYAKDAPAKAPVMRVGEVSDDAAKVKGSRSETTGYYPDGVVTEHALSGKEKTAPDAFIAIPEAKMVMDEEPVPASPVVDLDKVFSEDATDEAPTPFTPRPGEPAPRAGLLTAGEWNDLHNWNRHWVDLLSDGEIDNFEKMYGFYPQTRFSLLLANDLDYPIVDVPVTLYDPAGNAVWEARTNNNGQAELWANLFNEKQDGKAYTAVVEVDGKRHDLGVLKPYKEEINRRQIHRDCGASKNVDIVWTVDATGSMGDELEYLKTEVLDVIGRVKNVNPDLNIRMGSVFYRDQGDEYVVKSSRLSADIPQTVEYIRQQSAGGGGDYPEAVHSALEEAIDKQPWSTDAVARICFLVLDASPHLDPAIQESIRNSIREAAKKGIRIVPVSGSGIQKDTEFLLKFFGLATNGSYVFLTDHSGIGGKHLEPTTDEYTVEQLNDLLVRIITEYSTVEDCQGKTAIRFEDPQQQQQNNPQQALYYPNPAITQFTLELPFAADKVTLYDSEGKAAHSFTQLESGVHSIPVNDLPAGFYTLRIWAGGQVQSGKVIVIKG